MGPDLAKEYQDMLQAAARLQRVNAVLNELLVAGAGQGYLTLEQRLTIGRQVDEGRQALQVLACSSAEHKPKT